MLAYALTVWQLMFHNNTDGDCLGDDEVREEIGWEGDSKNSKVSKIFLEHTELFLYRKVDYAISPRLQFIQDIFVGFIVESYVYIIFLSHFYISFNDSPGHLIISRFVVSFRKEIHSFTLLLIYIYFVYIYASSFSNFHSLLEYK